MGDNAVEGIYIAVYVFIFIIALSTTIILFSMINNYANLSYEYGKTVDDKSLIKDVPTTSYRVVSGSQLISYYYNYVKTNVNNSYDVQILNEKNVAIKKSISSYAELINEVNPIDKYILNVDTFTTKSDGSVSCTIKIKKANSDELKQIS